MILSIFLNFRCVETVGIDKHQKTPWCCLKELVIALASLGNKKFKTTAESKFRLQECLQVKWV